MATFIIAALVILALGLAIRHVKKSKGSCCNCPGASTCGHSKMKK